MRLPVTSVPRCSGMLPWRSFGCLASMVSSSVTERRYARPASAKSRRPRLGPPARGLHRDRPAAPTWRSHLSAWLSCCGHRLHASAGRRPRSRSRRSPGSWSGPAGRAPGAQSSTPPPPDDLALEVSSSPLEAVFSGKVWEQVYNHLAGLIEAHRTTLIFVNTRRMAQPAPTAAASTGPGNRWPGCSSGAGAAALPRRAEGCCRSPCA